MILTMAKRRQMPAKDFAMAGHRFPMNDATHQRMAISGATRAYHAGNISQSTEQRIQAEARAKLHGGPPRSGTGRGSKVAHALASK